MEEFDFEEFDWGKESLVSSAYTEMIEKYNPAWQKEWVQKCNRKCCFSPDCGKISCEWCGQKIILSCQHDVAAPRYNCPECFCNPEVCVDLCENCFRNREWVQRDITEGAIAKYNLLNPDIDELPHREANPADPKCFCLVEFDEKEEVVALTCGHVFHNDCMAARLEAKAVPESVCPVCCALGD